MNFLCNTVIQFAFPLVEDRIGLNLTFGIFAALTAYR